MAWTSITKPSVGDPTKKTAFADAVVDDLTFLYNQFLSVVGNREIVINGSFESDSDADGYPDGWTRTLYSGGSFTWDQSTSAADGKAYHGKRAAKFTSPGGGGNGGGYIVSESYFEVTEGRPYKIQFATKSSVADVHNSATITWYDSTQASISTTTFHDDASTNPTSWETYEYQVLPPANSRYAKLGFYGCMNDDSTAGSTWFDDIRVFGFVPPFERRLVFQTAGTYKWKCPSGVSWAAIVVVGGGGGGGAGQAGAADAGGGGGAGGTSYDIQALTAGTSYTFAVGAAGGGGSVGNNGSDGGSSTFVGTATLLGAGGTGGVKGSSGGTGGGGGTASGGRVNTSGATGASRASNVGGDGGEAPPFGGYGIGGTATNAGSAAPIFGGGGGGGGGGAGTAGGSGSVGCVIILW